MSLNVLFTTWEGGGNVPPAITVARKLLARGHRVRFMSDEVNRADATAAGLAFHPWQSAHNRPDRTPASCPLRDWEAATPQEGIGRVLSEIMYGTAERYARDVAAVLEAEPADLVVTSEMLMGVLVACESRSQKVAILSTNLCLFPLEGMPLFGPGLPPPSTDQDHAMHEEIRSGMKAMLNGHLDSLNRARLAFGLAPVDCVLKQLDAAECQLLGTSRAFDYPTANPSPQIRYVGPQLDEPTWIQPWQSPWPPEDSRPLIVAGFSTTYQAHEAVLQRTVDAAAELPVRLLVTLGQIPSTALKPASNTVLVQSAPHNAVMCEAAIVVTHGGHGTVMRALKHRCPMLVMPHGRDQDENAARVAHYGAGIRLTATSSTDEIRTALRNLLDDPAFTKAAKELGSAIDAAAANEDAVTELETLACSKNPCNSRACAA